MHFTNNICLQSLKIKKWVRERGRRPRSGSCPHGREWRGRGPVLCRHRGNAAWRVGPGPRQMAGEPRGAGDASPAGAQMCGAIGLPHSPGPPHTVPGQARRRPAGETRMRGHGRGPRAPVGKVIPVRFLDRILYFHKHSECFPWAAFSLGWAGTGGRFSGHIERGKSVNFDLEER